MLWAKRKALMRKLSEKMQAEILAVVAASTRASSAVRVYAESETIRRANLADNIALEDIVEEMIARSKDGPGYEENPYDAVDALLGNPPPFNIVH
jgi:hypothetical protein